MLLQAAGGPGVDHARRASSARRRPCRSSKSESPSRGRKQPDLLTPLLLQRRTGPTACPSFLRPPAKSDAPRQLTPLRARQWYVARLTDRRPVGIVECPLPWQRLCSERHWRSADGSYHRKPPARFPGLAGPFMGPSAGGGIYLTRFYVMDDAPQSPASFDPASPGCADLVAGSRRRQPEGA